MSIEHHFDKNNLHHAYLIEGARDDLEKYVLSFFHTMGVRTTGNPDFITIEVDNFKMEEALALRALSSDKSFSGDVSGQAGKKVFLVKANTFSIDAENVLLKMFEEPIANTHFFLIVPDANALLKTLVSRFYFISGALEHTAEKQSAEKFIKMSLSTRIDFLKELLVEPDEEDEEGNEVIVLDSARSKALKFLNALEFILHKKFQDTYTEGSFFSHFFKVREFLRMPGSSVKSLMESVALITPIY